MAPAKHRNNWSSIKTTDELRSGLEALAAAPEDLRALGEAVALPQRLVEDRGRIEARFGPLRWVDACVVMCLREGWGKELEAGSNRGAVGWLG
jgi:hypothetical protein